MYFKKKTKKAKRNDFGSYYLGNSFSKKISNTARGVQFFLTLTMDINPITKMASGYYSLV